MWGVERGWIAYDQRLSCFEGSPDVLGCCERPLEIFLFGVKGADGLELEEVGGIGAKWVLGGEDALACW